MVVWSIEFWALLRLSLILRGPRGASFESGGVASAAALVRLTIRRMCRTNDAMASLKGIPFRLMFRPILLSVLPMSPNGKLIEAVGWWRPN